MKDVWVWQFRQGIANALDEGADQFFHWFRANHRLATDLDEAEELVDDPELLGEIVVAVCCEQRRAALVIDPEEDGHLILFGDQRVDTDDAVMPLEEVVETFGDDAEFVYRGRAVQFICYIFEDLESYQ